MTSDSTPVFALEKEALKTEIETGLQVGVLLNVIKRAAGTFVHRPLFPWMQCPIMPTSIR